MKQTIITLALLLPLIAGAQQASSQEDEKSKFGRNYTLKRVHRPRYYNHGQPETRAKTQIYIMGGLDWHTIPYGGVSFNYDRVALGVRLGKPEPLDDQWSFGFDVAINGAVLDNGSYLSMGFLTNADYGTYKQAYDGKTEGWTPAVTATFGYRIAGDHYFIKAGAGYRQSYIGGGLYLEARAGFALWKPDPD